MKKLAWIWLLPFAFSTFASECETNFVYGGLPRWASANNPDTIKVLTNCGCLVGYSESRKDPVWVAYHLREVGAPGQPADAPDRPGNFRIDERTDAKISDGDYANKKGFDRGHMAPSYGIGSRFGTNAQKETFLMSNVCPQAKDLNEQTWRFLEEKEANDYANAFDEVWVITGPIFNGASTTWPESGVQVPYAFYKIIVDEDKGKPRVLAFKMEQGDKPTHNFDPSLIKVKAIEKETGLKFFSDLPDADKLKSKSPAFCWKLPKKK